MERLLQKSSDAAHGSCPQRHIKADFLQTERAGVLEMNFRPSLWFSFTFVVTSLQASHQEDYRRTLIS